MVRIHKFIVMTSVGLGALIPASAGFAQRYIQGGRVLDHNLRQGSGGVNPNAPVPPINQSSRFISGNVTGGAAFQGDSPIRDSSQLFLNLPSSGLNNFRRDSLSVGDIVAGRTNLVNDPYYDRSSTVVNLGGITAGLNAPGTSMPQNTNFLPRLDTNYLPPEESLSTVPLPDLKPLDLRVNTLVESAPLEARVEREARSPLNPSLLGTNLFGPRAFLPWRDRADRRPEDGPPTHGDDFSNEPIVPETLDPLRLEPDSTDDSLLGSPLEQLIAPSPDELSTRLETQFDNYVPPIPINRNFAAEMPDPLSQGHATGNLLPERTYTPAPKSPDQAPTHPPAGIDVFTDMQMAALKNMQSPELGPDLSELLPEPLLPDGEPASPGLEVEPDVAPSPEDSDAVDTGDVGENDSMASISTFVGKGETQINQYLARAESDLRNGAYYAAAAAYSAASAIDPESPLPLLGRGHALIAAGDYVNAARYLVKAITIFPSVARFPLELGDLVQRPADLELRRVDIEQRLERNENHNLRFVLGYIEYFTGLPQFGAPNMAQAAEHLPGHPNLKKFIAMLSTGPGSLPATDAETP